MNAQPARGGRWELAVEARHRAALATLATLGLVLRGSIARRLTRCGHPVCRCHADPPLLQGPYYIWTRKIAGKTVTAQLKPEDTAFCKDWNGNMRTLDRTVRQLLADGVGAGRMPDARMKTPPKRGWLLNANAELLRAFATAQTESGETKTKGK